MKMNKQVYKLYELTEKEIKIVGGKKNTVNTPRLPTSRNPPLFLEGKNLDIQII